jgi:RimK family alpha-L-glutamate ligase
MDINEIRYDQIKDEDEARRLVESVNEASRAKLDESKKKPEEEETEGKDKPANKDDEKGNPNNPNDELEVKYADLDKELTNIFEHIIIFTNDDDPKNNKTLKNLYDAVAALKKTSAVTPKVHVFIAENMTFDTDDDNILSITDGDNTLDFEDLNNTNTLVFSRLGVQGEDNCEHVVGMLQDRGFLVLNPVRYSELASNKYDTAVLLQKAEIPQPNFCLMTKDILYDEKLFMENMKQVYPKWDKDSDKNEEFDLVVKILDGHGGTGVFTCDGKKLIAILQAIFAIDEERQLIIQKKEEADGGDIRVHVLTLRDRQLILAAMKRVKIGGDFRSNVSLGAEAEPVKLTPEQEQIALKAAKISHLPWCAVDIMPLVKGSNPEIGDNVVLELNASPGTDGISEVIKHNFINILLNELDEPKEFYLQDKTAGYMETVDITIGDGKPLSLLAKLDTGNGAIASHMEVGNMETNGENVTFTFNGKKYTEKIYGYSKAVTGTQKNNRPIIHIKSIKLGLRKLNDVPMALVENRDGKSSNVLLNREMMAWLGYLVSPYQTHILTQEIDKLKII